MTRIAVVVAAAAAVQPASTGRVWPAALRECTVEGIAERVRCATIRVAESPQLPCMTRDAVLPFRMPAGNR